jgi:peptide/nickel transport system substrate-binding protein
VQQIQGQNSALLVDMTDPGSFNTLHINLTQAPFDDLRVRQAIAHSIDRNALVAALAPMAKAAFSLSPPSYPTGWSHDDLPEELRYEFDPDRARELLAEAGFPDGFSFETTISQREDYRSIMLILQELFRASGIDMQLNIIDHSAFSTTLREGGLALSLLSQSLPPTPLDYYNRYLSSAFNATPDGKGGFNLSHYGVAIPGVDDKLAAMQQATTIEDYNAAGRDIELQVLRDLAVMNLITLGYVIIRNPSVDLGYELTGGYPRWRLNLATKA